MSQTADTLPDEFSQSERNEIIVRLQTMENQQAALIASVDRIEEFTDKLAQVLDALGNNPMLAAMLPADVAQSMMGGS